MRTLSTAFVMLALAGCIAGPTVGDDAGAELLGLQDKWAKARIARDVAFLRDFYTPDFRVLALDGNEVSREEDIANFETGLLKPESIINDSMQVRVYGEVAIVTGIERLRGSYRDIPGQFTLRFTNVYIRDQARWRLAHHHSTEIRAR